MATGKLGTPQSELGNIVLGISGSQSVVVGVSEAVLAAESASLVSALQLLASETALVSEDVSATFDAQVAGSETVVATENGSLLTAATVGVAETITGAESTNIQRGAVVSTTEIVSESEMAGSSRGVLESVSEVVAEAESIDAQHGVRVAQAESVFAAELSNVANGKHLTVSESVSLYESITIRQQSVLPSDQKIRILFSSAMSLDGLLELDNYQLVAWAGSYPMAILSVSPLTNVLQSGTGTTMDGNLVLLSALPLIGDYLYLGDSTFARVLDITPRSLVVLDRALPPGDFTWTEVTFYGVDLTTTRGTNGREYRLDVSDLTSASGRPVTFSEIFTAVASLPRLVSVQMLAEGQLLLTFSAAMRPEPATNPSEYSITGPTDVEVLHVQTVSPTQFVLQTHGMGAGSYTLTVNALGTPKDAAGNPIDPVYNVAAFTGATPLSARSIFTDKGPIAKPPLTLQTGATAYITAFTEVAMPTGVLLPSLVGKYLTINGSTNGGTYRISAIIPASGLLPPRVRVQASFTLPDTGPLTWVIFDPRDGQIADDPSDVAVTVHGLPVTPEAVLGLLGQIVLPSRPAPGSDVVADYSFVRNPEVEIRRLNSKEFHLNGWNRDVGRPNDASQHKYRFNNVLITPASYVIDDLQANLPEPIQRDLKYRAYERAYTAVLNDPNLLLLNSPSQRIAFPPLERTVSSTFVNYDALVLPEVSSPPWERHGLGTAYIDNGELVVQDTSGGPFPSGEPVFWFRKEETSFDHVLAATWRMRVTADPVTEDVFTGVCVGYSGEEHAFVLGCLDVGGIKQLGILKRGYGNDPTQVEGWTGGLDSTLNPTGLPTDFDWTVEHSFRLFRGLDGTVRIYVDGEIVEILRVLEDELPFLEELNAPFDALEGFWFGSLSRPAMNTSRWTFVRYEVLPTNPYQIAPSIYVSYEGTTPPEDASEPWTPVGYHGTETIVGGNLVLDSTSATDDVTEAKVGLVGGDFKGFMKLEPLLAAASENVLDVNVQLRTWTHGIDRDAVTAAIDDGDRLIQLSFFADKAAPKLSYGGRSFPDEWTPLPWSKAAEGNATSAMIGRTLRVSNPDASSGLVYYIDDAAPAGSDARTASVSTQYALDFRVLVHSYTPDPAGYCGVQATVFDGTRSVGLMLEEISGVRYVTLHADGNPVPGGRFPFEWNDGAFHTFRATKRSAGIVTLVSVFADAVYLGAVDYTAIGPLPVPSPIGTISFGSSTPTSMMALSVVDWVYCNAFRVLDSCRKYIGIWNGLETDSLLGYHLPIKVSGSGLATGLTLAVDPLPAHVRTGDLLVIDEGANRGVYEIHSITGPRTTLGVTSPFPFGPSMVSYRIAQEIDWTVAHKYRVLKDPGSIVSLVFDSTTEGLLLDPLPTPLMTVSYNQIELPHRSAGIFMAIANNLPSISFGAFDPTNLSQTGWDFVRFGITRSPTEMQIVPPHQVLNQRNVMASYEHVQTLVPHSHTDYWSSSTGIPPQTDPDFQRTSGVMAFTLLNGGTPLVPKTQTAETRAAPGGDLYPIQETVSGLGRPEDVLNSDRDFVLNDGSFRWKLHVPDDVLYNSLEVIETQTGSEQIYPFDDDFPNLGMIYYQRQACLRYNGDVLPELDTSAPTPWECVADDPNHIQRSAFGGILTFGTDSVGTRTSYRNFTPLPDSPGLQTEARFRLRLAHDSSGGTGDTQVRFGLIGPGYTMALAFVTAPTGIRYVYVRDLKAGTVVGGTPFDFGDGLFHTYRIVRNIGDATIQVFIDS